MNKDICDNKEQDVRTTDLHHFIQYYLQTSETDAGKGLPQCLVYYIA